jgi:NAD-dependent dihydropyrimidine dehydrogenase PreA subunit
MIELVSKNRCIECNKCVQVCPTNVFDAVPNGVPVIARQEDCQTCFLCEIYCPTDALFVHSEAWKHVEVNEEELIEKGLLGKYRWEMGWHPNRTVRDRWKEQEEVAKRIKVWKDAQEQKLPN